MHQISVASPATGLRGDPAISFIPVFVLTSSDRRRDIDEVHDLNICGYIVKPVAINQMLEALSTLDSFCTLGQNPSPRDSLGKSGVS